MGTLRAINNEFYPLPEEAMSERRRYPSLINAYTLMDPNSIFRSVTAGLKINGKECWVPARSEGFCSYREAIKLAWGVFRGRYDALVWPGQGDQP